MRFRQPNETLLISIVDASSRTGDKRNGGTHQKKQRRSILSERRVRGALKRRRSRKRRRAIKSRYQNAASVRDLQIMVTTRMNVNTERGRGLGTEPCGYEGNAGPIRGRLFRLHRYECTLLATEKNPRYKKKPCLRYGTTTNQRHVANIAKPRRNCENFIFAKNVPSWERIYIWAKVRLTLNQKPARSREVSCSICSLQRIRRIKRNCKYALSLARIHGETKLNDLTKFSLLAEIKRGSYKIISFQLNNRDVVEKITELFDDPTRLIMPSWEIAGEFSHQLPVPNNKCLVQFAYEIGVLAEITGCYVRGALLNQYDNSHLSNTP